MINKTLILVCLVCNGALAAKACDNQHLTNQEEKILTKEEQTEKDKNDNKRKLKIKEGWDKLKSISPKTKPARDTGW